MTIEELLNKAKQRAKRKGLKFELKKSDLVIPKVCPILGKKIQRGGRLAASIDRINPKLGYIKENVQVVSVLSNRMMSDATEEELVLFAEWVMKEIKPRLKDA